MKLTYASYSFGCRTNEAENVAINQNLENQGFSYDGQNPEFFIINSCAVTAKAEREVRQFINQTRKKYPRSKIVLTGCALTAWIMKNKNDHQADMVFDNAQKDSIAETLTVLKKAAPLTKKADFPGSQARHDKFLNSGRLMVKITDGCNRYCSFCIVPYLRGKPVSYPLETIIGNIRSYGQTVKEVVLTGINTQYTGLNQGYTLTELVDEIIKNTDIPRISLGSVHPWSIDNNFIKWYRQNRQNPRFVHFFHIPIQSGSMKVLKLMNRGYAPDQISDHINRLYQLNPDALFGTDIIVGFPGETESDFMKTYRFLEDNPFSKFHIFRYSSRSGTVACRKEKSWGMVDSQSKKIRSSALHKLNRYKYLKFLKKFINAKGNALILNRYFHGYQEALFSHQIPVTIKTSQKIPPGSVNKIIITQINKTGAEGELIEF